MDNNVKIRVGNVEFECSGEANFVKEQQYAFLKNITDVQREFSLHEQPQTAANQTKALANTSVGPQPMAVETDTAHTGPQPDLSRTSLASALSDIDVNDECEFVLLAMRFLERKAGERYFSSANVRESYNEARRHYTNVSVPISRLAKRGLIMEVPPKESTGKSKTYMLTDQGVKLADSKLNLTI